MVTAYICARCNKEFSQRSNYKDHTKRKHRCGPAESVVVPTMQNYKLVKRDKYGQTFDISFQQSNNNEVNIENTTTHTTNNTTNIHNHVHVHNEIKLVDYGQEDLSYITPKIIECLLSMNKDDVDVICELIKCVHFNPAKPEHMNVYADAHSTHLFQNKQWNECKNNGDAAMHVAQRYADTIKKHLETRDEDEGFGLVDEERAVQFEDLHSDFHRCSESEKKVLSFLRKHACMVPCKNEQGDFLFVLSKRSAIGTAFTVNTTPN
jgi:hypothetical protein